MATQHGWPVEESLFDAGLSAWKGDHLATGKLGDITRRIKNGELGHGYVLVVERLDRLSRQAPRTAQRWIEDACEAGLAIATVDGDRVYTNASLSSGVLEIFEILLKASSAEEESSKKSARVSDARDRKHDAAARGETIITAKCPGWLAPNETRTAFIVRDDRASVVLDIYRLAAEGRGAGWITGHLNEANVLSFSGGTWSLSSVANLLANPAVEGDYVCGWNAGRAGRSKKARETIYGYFPRVIPADLVAQARAAVAGRRQTGGPRSKGIANLFAGLVRCGTCGHKMHLSMVGGDRQERRFRCEHAARRRGCLQSGSWRYEPFERAVLDGLLHYALGDSDFSHADKARPMATKLAEMDKALETAELALERLTDAIELAEDPSSLIVRYDSRKRALGDLRTDREKLATQLAHVRGAVAPAEHLARVREVRAKLDSLDRVERETARLQVQTSMNGLGVKARCTVQNDGSKGFVVSTADGLFQQFLDNNGGVKMRIDTLEFATLPGLGEMVEAASGVVIKDGETITPAQRRAVADAMGRGKRTRARTTPTVNTDNRQ